MFPGPVGIVENLKFDDFCRSGDNLNDLLRFALADGTSFLPVLFATLIPIFVQFLVPLRSAFQNLLLPLLSSPVLAFIGSELIHELVDHVLERLFTINTALFTFASTVSTGLADRLHWVLVNVLTLCLLFILGLSRSYINFSDILRSEKLLLDILVLFLELSFYEILNSFSGDTTSLLLGLLAALGLVLLLGNFPHSKGKRHVSVTGS